MSRKTKFKLLKFEIWNFQTTSDRETTKMKVIYLEKLCNFVIDNFLIWIRLGSQTINLNSIEDNTRKKKIHYRHKWEWGVVVRGVSCEGEVVDLNPAGAKCTKNTLTCQFYGRTGGWLVGPPRLFFFCYFFETDL